VPEPADVPGHRGPAAPSCATPGQRHAPVVDPRRLSAYLARQFYPAVAMDVHASLRGKLPFIGSRRTQV